MARVRVGVRILNAGALPTRPQHAGRRRAQDETSFEHGCSKGAAAFCGARRPKTITCLETCEAFGIVRMTVLECFKPTRAATASPIVEQGSPLLSCVPEGSPGRQSGCTCKFAQVPVNERDESGFL